ncbi:MAG: aryl-sulfate sulfotransferase [Lachnospiraceae bacterium]|nr:aryl-sulfate sulfotransferase [Lachnospiraceae bacterium]
MKKLVISLSAVAAAVVLVLGVYQFRKGTEEDFVTPQETANTKVISAGAVEAFTSQTIPEEEYLPVKSRKVDGEMDKKAKSDANTWEKPEILVNPYENSPLTAYLFFTTDRACGVRVTVKGKISSADITGTLKKKTKKHRVPVVGLYPGKKNKVQISCLDENGKAYQTQTVTIETEPLPSELQDAVQVKKQGRPSAYGLTILSGQSTKYPFAYDENGDIRWYVKMTTGSYGVFPLSNKRLIFQTDASLTPTEEKPHTTQMYEMDYMGRVYQIYYVKNGIHHEVIEKTPGGNLLVLTSSIDGHTEDMVIELDRETGEIVKSLDMREIFDGTYENKVDWVHLNTASYKEEDNTVLLSPRNVHAGIKLDWTTNEIKWILANPEMFKGTEQEDKVLKPVGDFIWHFQQHSVYEIPYDLDGEPDTIHVMLYDNHWQTKRKVDFFDGRENSYVSVYAINEKEMTVRQEKHFESVRSIITSNCAYDKKSNRMFSFGGYLHPLIENRKGMVYEYDYGTGEVLNQYSAKEYFYRGYEMVIDWKDLAAPMEQEGNYVKGTLQAPVEAELEEKPEETLGDDVVSFVKKESVLYMKTNDHAIDQVAFHGQNHQYLMDYTNAGKGLKKNRKVTYSIAIPVSGLAEDEYKIAVRYQGKWYDTGKDITCHAS